jgi:hypothetical protein
MVVGCFVLGNTVISNNIQYGFMPFIFGHLMICKTGKNNVLIKNIVQPDNIFQHTLGRYGRLIIVDVIKVL